MQVFNKTEKKFTKQNFKQKRNSMEYQDDARIESIKKLLTYDKAK